MAYGTGVDITIDLNGETYYIPAIIVDVKEHSAYTGEIQTGIPFFREDEAEDTGKSG